MAKKILIGIIIALVIIGIILAVYFLKPKSPQETPKQEEKKEEVTPESLDESIKSTIETLKPTCADFLAGDISGEDDCQGFDRLVNQDLCYYCFAAKKQDAELCKKISEYSGFKMVCEKVTGSTIDQIINK